ncbi:MAG: hypothetical protein J0G30_07800 [Actinomycetales bacterium]|nr:hypothetical protein [Actinomycetales bacterium]
MAARQTAVPRPAKKAEYELRFVTRQAELGWRDLVATTRNAMADAWDYLTRNPLRDEPKNHELRGALATVTHAGATHRQRQYELPGGARIWYYVDGRVVMLVNVHTAHPNATK